MGLQITINRPDKRNAFTPRTGKDCWQCSMKHHKR
jgi:1,4-dihydroxy-2-naphthoyl-CoA synthase